MKTSKADVPLAISFLEAQLPLKSNAGATSKFISPIMIKDCTSPRRSSSQPWRLWIHCKIVFHPFEVSFHENTFKGMCYDELELELELIQTRMIQKLLLWAEVGKSACVLVGICGLRLSNFEVPVGTWISCDLPGFLGVGFGFRPKSGMVRNSETPKPKSPKLRSYG